MARASGSLADTAGRSSVTAIFRPSGWASMFRSGRLQAALQSEAQPPRAHSVACREGMGGDSRAAWQVGSRQATEDPRRSRLAMRSRRPPGGPLLAAGRPFGDQPGGYGSTHLGRKAEPAGSRFVGPAASTLFAVQGPRQTDGIVRRPRYRELGKRPNSRAVLVALAGQHRP